MHEQVKESKRLVKCFLNYLRHDKAEVNVLFEMLSIFLVQTRIDYTFLKEYYMVEVRPFGICNWHYICLINCPVVCNSKQKIKVVCRVELLIISLWQSR